MSPARNVIVPFLPHLPGAGPQGLGTQLETLPPPLECTLSEHLGWAAGSGASGHHTELRDVPCPGGPWWVRGLRYCGPCKGSMPGCTGVAAGLWAGAEWWEGPPAVGEANRTWGCERSPGGDVQGCTGYCWHRDGTQSRGVWANKAALGRVRRMWQATRLSAGGLGGWHS